MLAECKYRSGYKKEAANLFNEVRKRNFENEVDPDPEFISRISMPESFKKPPSIPISPNSFSIRTTFSPAIASFRSFFINVVFPAPRKPEIISIFVIMTPLSCHPRGIPVFLSVRLNFILYTDQIHCRTFIFHYQLLTLTHFPAKSSTAAFLCFSESGSI